MVGSGQPASEKESPSLLSIFKNIRFCCEMSRDRGTTGQVCGCGNCGVVISAEEGKKRCRCANTWIQNACYASTYECIMCPSNDNDNINKEDDIEIDDEEEEKADDLGERNDEEVAHAAGVDPSVTVV